MSICADSHTTWKSCWLFFLSHTQSPKIVNFIIMFSLSDVGAIMIPPFIWHRKNENTEFQIRNASNNILHSVNQKGSIFSKRGFWWAKKGIKGKRGTILIWGYSDYYLEGYSILTYPLVSHLCIGQFQAWSSPRAIFLMGEFSTPRGKRVQNPHPPGL